MKRRMFVFAILFALALIVAPGGKKIGASGWSWHYVQYENCVGWPGASLPVGDWYMDCDGNWTGWGSMPGDPCTYTNATPVEYCGPDQQG